MAKLLYKLGIFSAKRAWLVLTTWILILASTVTAMALTGAKFTTSMSIPGTPAQQIIDDLKTSFPNVSRGSAQVVFHTSGNDGFSSTEKQQVRNALEQVRALAGVADVINPFTTQADIAKKRQDVTDGEKKIADGKLKIADGFAKLDQARKDLKSNQAKINSAIPQLKAALADLNSKLAQVEAGIAQAQAYHAPQAQIDALLGNKAQILGGISQVKQKQADVAAGQKKIDQGYVTVAKNQAKLEKANRELLANEPKLAVAKRLLAVTANFKTVSTNSQTAVATVLFTQPINVVETSLKNRVVSVISASGLTGIEVNYSQSLTQDLSGILGIGEIVGLLMAALILFVMLSSLIAAGLPVISAIVGVGISATLTVALSNVFDMTSTTPTLGVMLGLAVGIDYSLFILNRHRRQLKTGIPVRESIALANGTSGNAVMFAGLTVIIALVALNITQVDFLGMMGNVAAGAVVISVLVAITFMPALLSLLGHKVLSRKERSHLDNVADQKAAETPKNADQSVWAAKHPWVTLVATVATLLIAAMPFASMRLGLPDGSSEPTDSTQYRAYQLVAQDFGAGMNDPIVVVATIPNRLEEQGKLELQANLAELMMSQKNVESVLPAAVSNDGTKYMFSVVPSEGPTSVSTEQLVYHLRDLAPKARANFNAELGVTGHTAATIDIADKLASVLPYYLGTVLVLSLLILMLVFRSLLVPLVASFGFLLSVFATFGAVVAVFQWGFGSEFFGVANPGPILSFLPTIVIGVLFGLAMDYQLFLVSGMREAYAHGRDPKAAVNYGMHLSRSVVVAAAAIMIFVFGGFAFSHIATVKPMGFALAVGVLFDAFVVRLLLMPAIMTILGKSAWYLPRWIDRLLPDVDVEGAKLERAIH